MTIFNKSKAHDRGSIAVTAALLLTLFLGIMAFTMDVGYLYVQRNRLQNCAEASALAAVQRLCAGDYDQVAQSTARQNGLSDGDLLSVETGFYDSLDIYSTPMGTYVDFGPPPVGENVNAVHVRIVRDVQSLSGMGSDVKIEAEAVAYLVNMDMVSLSDQGHIHIGLGSTWNDTVFFSNGTIDYPSSITVNGKQYPEPIFNRTVLFAVGDIEQCPQRATTASWWSPSRYNGVDWTAGTVQTGGAFISSVEPVTEIHPVDHAALAHWRARADRIYTPADAGSDEVFFHQGTCACNPCIHCTPPYFYFDLAGQSGTIFFDAGDTGGTVLIGPCCAPDHTPNGDSITGVTFVSTCTIRILNLSGDEHQTVQELHMGGEGDQQVQIISAHHIILQMNRMVLDGVVFRSGNDFIWNKGLGIQTGPRGQDVRMRVVADGSIYGYCFDCPSPPRDSGVAAGAGIYSHFAPPCMPGVARLGRLTRSGS